MPMQIVTGYTGTEHIKSSHDRSRIAGIAGAGLYVLSTGNKLAAALQNANTVRISDGDLVMQGTHATIESGSYEDVTIENGTQGQKRNDLIVVRYEKAAQQPQTESIGLKVIKGTPTSGTPADPDYEEGDILAGDLVAEMPLYRVPIDGITPGEPVPMADVLMPMAELWDSVSQLPTVVSGTTRVTGTFSSSQNAGRFFRARVDFGQDLGTDDYALVATLQWSGIHAYLSVYGKDATGFDAYIVTTGTWSTQSFDVMWVAVV